MGVKLSDYEAAQRLTEIGLNWDVEEAHCDADDLLCDLLEALGYSKTVEAFRALEKWYA